MEDTHALLPLGPMARSLGLPVRWLRNEADAGRLPHLKVEKEYLFSPEAVVRALVVRASTGPDEPEAA